MRKMREKIEKMEIAEAEALNQLQEEKRKAERTDPPKLPAKNVAVKPKMAVSNRKYFFVFYNGHITYF